MEVLTGAEVLTEAGAPEAADSAEVVEEEASTDSRTSVLRRELLLWESSCIHVKMTSCVSVRRMKTKFPTSTLRSTWKTRSRSGK